MHRVQKNFTGYNEIHTPQEELEYLFMERNIIQQGAIWIQRDKIFAISKLRLGIVSKLQFLKTAI